MKKRLFCVLSASALVVGASIVFTSRPDYKQAFAITSPKYSSSMPTTIKLGDNTSDEIRSYYSSLNNLDASERTGTNLLKNLKPILMNNMVYYNYGSISSSGVTQIYTITDRDWENSPVSTIASGTYNSETNTITGFNHGTEKNNDPYIKMLYIDYDKTGPTNFLKGTQASFDKEHVWSQSHGFKASSGAEGPAGTDLHHLIAGEKTVNQQYHSNWSYGEVDESDTKAKIATESTTGSLSPSGWYITGNKLGKSKTLDPSHDETTNVFEPNDADKGRIARALLYMVARYNNYANDTGVISNYEPYLELIDYIIGNTTLYSTDTTSVKYGQISYLLKWNREYLPDEFEIHRNNLIYNNYQFNRNPFIDFPEWADYIWGNEESGYVSTGYADPTKDLLNDFKIAVSSVSLNESQLDMKVGDSTNLTATVLPSNATNKNVSWSSSNTSAVEVNNGVLTAKAVGNSTITVTTQDGSKTATCAVTVAAKSSDPIQLETSLSVESYATSNNWEDATKYTSMNIDSIITATVSGTNNNGKYYINGYNWRLYQSGSGSITISAATNYVIDKLTIKYSSSSDGVLLDSSSNQISSETEYTINANSVTYTVGNTNEGSSGQARITDFNVKYHSTVPDDTPRVISLSISDSKIAFDLNGEKVKQITATVVAINGASTAVTWSSDDSAIASVDQNGNITAKAVGSTVVRVKSSIDNSVSKSCNVDVKRIERGHSPYANGVAYKLYFSSTYDSKEGDYYFTGEMSGYYGATSKDDYSKGTNVYFESNGNGQSLYFEDQNGDKQYIGVSLNGTKINFVFGAEKQQWFYSESEGCIFTIINLVRYTIGTNGSYVTFNGYDLDKNPTYYLPKFALTAETFAYYILNKIGCDENGVVAPNFLEGYSWTELKTIYEGLDSSQQELLQGNADVDGDIIERALAKYDYIVNKYNNLENFISRTITPQSNIGIVSVDNGNIGIIIASISGGLVILTIGLSFISKRRKEEY